MFVAVLSLVVLGAACWFTGSRVVGLVRSVREYRLQGRRLRATRARVAEIRNQRKQP